MKRMLIALMMLTLVAGLVTGGVMAAWSDTETSTGNTFQAGNLDLALSSGSGYNNEWSGPIATVSNLAPGQEVGPFCMYFQNQGSIAGIVTVDMSYVEADYTPQTGEFANIDVGPNTFAKALIVTWANVDGGPTNVAPYWAQQVIDDAYGGNAGTAATAKAVVADAASHLPTMYGLSQITLHFWESYSTQIDEVFNPGDSRYDCFKLKLDGSVGNDYMFDGIDITITAILTQITY